MPKPQILSGYSWNEPSPLDHDGFHNRAVDLAVKLFNNKRPDETLIGYFVFVTGEQTAVIHCPWDNVREKDLVSASLRLMLQEPIIEAYSFITEAWAVLANKDDKNTLKVPPSQHPDREDVFQIFTTLRSGETKMTRFGVKIYPPKAPWLPPHKKARLLERDDEFMKPGVEMAGVMFNFFESLEESERKNRRAYAKAKREQNKRQQKENEDDNG